MEWWGVVKKHGEELIYSGAWVIAIGTVIAAVGQTKETATGSLKGARLVTQGNVVGALGNSLQALGYTDLFMEDKEQFRVDDIIGAWLQTGGNSTIAVATEMKIHGSEEEGARINAVGSGVLGLGAVYEAIGAAEGNSPTKNLEVTGNSLIALGAFLDSAGNISSLNKLEASAEILELIGIWVQVIGTFTNLIAIKTAMDINKISQESYFDPYYNYHQVHLYEPNFNRMR